MNEIADSWRRIAAWHQAQGATRFQLAPGATEDQLTAAERALGRRLPADVRASWALHDGGVTDSTWLSLHGELLTLKHIVEQWEQRRELERDFGIGPDRRHIPVTDNSGDGLLIGPAGEVIDFDHEIGPRGVIAPSWAAFLAQFASDLETGKLVYFAKHHTVAEPGAFVEPTHRRRFVRGAERVEIFIEGTRLVTFEFFASGASGARECSPDPIGPAYDAEVARILAAGYVEVTS